MFKNTTQLQLSDSFKNNLKLRLSGISGAFMLPIATMAITSFFLSVGGTLALAHPATGQAFQSVALPLLQAFPLFICISFALAFTKENQGIAVWCALLSFLTFIYLQSACISCNSNGEKCECSCKTVGTNCCSDGKCSCLLPCCATNSKYTILFQAGRESITQNSVHKLFGVTTLNSSIFPSLIIGGIIIPHLFKHYSEIKLPTYLSYFSGKRLLPLLSCLAVVPLAFLFLIFWPWINYGLGYIGNQIAKSKGADAFLFGFLEKALIPTGFHHLFASLFWYTPLGGDVYLEPNIFKQLCCNGTATNNCCLSSTNLSNSLQWQGDALIGMSALSLPRSKFNGSKDLHIARFTQGKFPIMQFALPAAALAIYLSSRPEKKKERGKVLFPGIWNSIILGITEPIEFSFMYTLPKLFYLFHTTMCGVSFLCMKSLDAHIPTAFSGGIIELIINGVISVHRENKFYFWAVVGSGLAIVYFTVFYFSFKWNNRREKLADQEVIQEQRKEKLDEELNHLPPQIASFKKGLGGWGNVTNYKNCASRLRYDIQDKSKVIESELKKAGVIAIKWVSDNHVQLIVGPKAEEINTQLLKYKEEEKK